MQLELASVAFGVTFSHSLVLLASHWLHSRCSLSSRKCYPWRDIQLLLGPSGLALAPAVAALQVQLELASVALGVDFIAAPLASRFTGLALARLVLPLGVPLVTFSSLWPWTGCAEMQLELSSAVLSVTFSYSFGHSASHWLRSRCSSSSQMLPLAWP